MIKTQKTQLFGLVLAVCLLLGRSASADLVAHWTFDEGGGNNAVDEVGGVAGNVINATWTDGLLPSSKSALDFNGDAHVDVTGQDWGTFNQVSIAVWLKFDSFTGTFNSICHEDWASGGIHFNLLNSGLIELAIKDRGPNQFRSQTVLEAGETYHVIATFDITTGHTQIYINGVLDSEGGSSPAASEIYLRSPFTIGSWNTSRYLDGVLDDFRIYDHIVTAEEIPAIMAGVPVELASAPLPKDGQIDVLRDVMLGWAPGEFAATHNVYLGTTWDDVNDAVFADAVNSGLTDTTYDAGVLEFGQTYYWRVDEVNVAPDNTVFKGQVWSFTAEPYSIPIETVQASASSQSADDTGPQNTVNGVGLDELDQHSTDPNGMWLSDSNEVSPWIQYDFDKLYRLDTMLVWNSNQSGEPLYINLSVKDVTIEISVDGTTWTPVDNVLPFAQGTGQSDYQANTTVDLGGATAKMVKINIINNYGQIPVYSLSEVRFLAIPTCAREPQPEEGTVTDSVDVELSWRAGREAVSHQIYLGTDVNDLALADTTTDSIYAVALDYGTTYYWSVTEVNDTEAVTAYAGPVWSFTTPPYAVVDDFESYNDLDVGEVDSHRIYLTWIDGYQINDNGLVVGHLNGPFAETTTVHNGSQSMPLFYDNSISIYAEAVVNLPIGTDWSQNGIKSLSLNIYGDPDNSGGQLYLKINNAKIPYDGLTDVLQRQQWISWIIDLSIVNSLQNVTSLTIGIEGAGATGVVYVDDMRLYPLAKPEAVLPVVPDNSNPNLIAHYEFEGNSNDRIGNYPGTAEGTPEYTTGKIGQAMVFDGIDDQVVFAFAEEQVFPAYSVALWVQTDIFGQAVNNSPFNNNSSTLDFQIDVDGSNPGNYRYVGSAITVLGSVVSDWVHLAASCDGITTSVYYNGLLIATMNVADTRFGQIGIGINRGMNKRFQGLIDDVYVYDRALSDAEIAGLAGITDSVPQSF